jgi:hypothetical protein
MPACHALIEHGHFTCQERPGRKTDLADAEWLVHLLECGLLAGSSS